jgi:phosphoribosyl-AMP cyclohydrolase
MEEWMQDVRFDAQGLVTVVVQDATSMDVLMVAYMNADTLRQTLRTGVMTYWSRSRNRVWVKGETSGHVQHVREARVDCDGDALLFLVDQAGGAACHTGHRACFYRRQEGGLWLETEPPLVDEATLYGTPTSDSTPETAP